ncbi:right-handed parallel beta-helix repeat-containing protein [Fulvivirgaceae bacterium BMA10]|uniref:Right-handed parallel beta-helix repeat-containing protein n=1 Tax=Splendidivirga corallicola TaxID=3051826 RepID=A0ABT8KZ48_9BACT|nr:right-handed parallel beta-helix repeat-containing protein [Fulvivirgaceae bacterium BMA10]
MLLILSVSISISCGEPEKIGNIYYVSGDGNDDNDGLTKETPWKTTDRVRKQGIYHPGDEILFKRGDQFGTLFFDGNGNGTKDNPITVGAYGDSELPRPVLDANRTTLKALYLKSSSNWTFKDLKFQGSKSHQILIDPEEARCDNIKILNCHIDGRGGKHAIRINTDPNKNTLYGSNNIEIAHCYIENAGQGKDSVSDGINAPNIQQNAFIHDNTFFNNVSEAIDIGAGKGHIIENNVIDGNGYYHSGGIKTHVQTGNKIHDTENMDIRYNIIRNCIQHGIQIQDGRDIRVYNNTVYHNHPKSRVALLIGSANEDTYDIQSWIKGNKIKNNIFHGVVSNPDQTTVRIVGDKHGGPAKFWKDTTRYCFQNNILYGGEDPDALIVRVRLGLDSYIDFRNQAVAQAHPFEEFLEIHQKNSNVNPLFKDPEGRDFSLRAGSPGINGGIEIGHDKDAKGNPIINRPDIGAIESGT